MTTTTVLTDPRAFDALEPEWSALLATSASNSVTLTWEWLSTWWSVYGRQRRLRIVLVREDGRLIGAAPLLARQHAHRYYRVLPFRRMELLASGEDRADQVCSDYLDWIAARGREYEVVHAIFDCLGSDLGAEWDELQLPDVSVESPVLAALEEESRRRGFGFEMLRREPCSVCPLPADWDAFLAGLSSGLRYKIRRGLRELEQHGGHYHVVSQESELAAASRVLIDLHQDRWTKKGKPGAFKSDARREFHERLMPLALRRGWLRLGVLRTGTEPIGAIYSFLYAGRVFFYQSGIHLPGSTNLRPGLLMHALEIQHAIGVGCHEYDFLKRGRSDYKDMWTNCTRDLACVRVARPGVKDAALHVLWRGHDQLRDIKDRMAARAARRLPAPDPAPTT